MCMAALCVQSVEKAACLQAARSLGYNKIKEEQLEVVLSFIAGNDVFVCLPTGFGKSLCFSMLPKVFDLLGAEKSIVIVLTPLTAIIQDQVDHLKAKGLRVATVTSGQDDIEILNGIRKGAYSLVLFTPEMLLQTRKWREMLLSDIYTQNLKALVIDEAHTVKKWGESFRKILLQIGELRSLVPQSVNMMALTATVTKFLKVEVIRILGMKNPITVSASPSRSNIKYIVSSFKSMNDAFRGLIDGLREKRKLYPQTIIYCRKQSECGDLYIYIRDSLGKYFTEPIGAPDLPKYRIIDMYHSSTDSSIKEIIIKLFSSADTQLRVVIATVAFGMGIDCPQVRQVIHLGSPSDREAYIQESGRAGRDGQSAVANLLLIKGIRQYADVGMKKYISNSSLCRRSVLFGDFEGYSPVSSSKPCSCCDICSTRCKCLFCESSSIF